MGKNNLTPAALAFLCFTFAIWWIGPSVSQAVGVEKNSPARPMGYAGSTSCRECHERFYHLWSTSRHGLAMQPYRAEFAKKNLTSQTKEVKIGQSSYRPDIAGETGWILEKGPKGQKKHKIEHALGGKNVYYFLTPFPRGRLQTLPLAFDVKKKEWFDTAASGIRHFPGIEGGQAVSWLAPAYTFNTSCFSCHVSQLTMHYDLKTDTYDTQWAEPGINCETCHGPSEEHNRVCREAPKGTVPKDLKIIRTKPFTAEQHNSSCSVCHAKMSPITPTFTPGDRFFDHFDLVTLEDPDFYPDGRDLGENYTYTSWRMSPCARAGELHCVKCHTSSGRYRFREEKDANNACMPCHKQRVENAAAHTHHQEGNPGNKCISCHMPMTSFARMNRSDHSMLPPTPSATIAYQSPNACNLCHEDKDAAWADKHVREWRSRDYQAPVLKRAALIEAARKRDWSKLPEILAYINDPKGDEIFATSLIRLIQPRLDQKAITALLEAAKDPSPLVRGAAIEALGLIPTTESLQALIVAAGDEYRLVRVRAAAGIASFPRMSTPPTYQAQLRKANDEYFASLTARPDQWTSHYNMGNYLLGRGDLKRAVASYQVALKLDPQAIMAMLNTSIAYARMGENDKAEKSLQKALKQAPDNAAANFNMGLLKADQKDLKAAEKYLKAALKADPQMAPAAYNLCIITAKDRINEAVTWCRKASDLKPQEPKYAYALAFYLNQKGNGYEAVRILKPLVEAYPQYKDAGILLKELSK